MDLDLQADNKEHFCEILTENVELCYNKYRTYIFIMIDSKGEKTMTNTTTLQQELINAIVNSTDAQKRVDAIVESTEQKKLVNEIMNESSIENKVKRVVKQERIKKLIDEFDMYMFIKKYRLY